MHGLQPKQNQYFKESLPSFTTLKTLNKVNKNYTVLITSLLLYKYTTRINIKKLISSYFQYNAILIFYNNN